MAVMILTLDQFGSPHRWSTWQEAVVYKAKDLVAWSQGEVSFRYRGGKNRISGLQSEIIVPSIIAVKSDFYVKYRQTPLTNKNLFRRDLNTCAYCGGEYSDHKLTRDHIHPTSKGGQDIWMNTITACKVCNSYKSDRLLGEHYTDEHYLNGKIIELKYYPYIPDKAESMILKNRILLKEQSDYLINLLPVHSRAGRLHVE